MALEHFHAPSFQQAADEAGMDPDGFVAQWREHLEFTALEGALDGIDSDKHMAQLALVARDAFWDGVKRWIDDEMKLSTFCWRSVSGSLPSSDRSQPSAS